jgi:cytochrome P450
MADTLTSDDPRYRELFDVSKETLAGGGQVQGDLSSAMTDLLQQAPVMKGTLGELLKLPVSHSMWDSPREHYTLLNFAACDRALRENLVFSSEGYNESLGVMRMGENILSMTGRKHISYRKIFQPKFLRPIALSLWRPKWIHGAVNALLDRLLDQETADLNLELCARLPVHVVTEGMGLGGAKALEFREHLLRSTVLTHGVSQEEIVASASVVTSMLQELINERREEALDDVVSAMVLGKLELEDGSSRPLTDQEIINNCRLIMVAGGGTTWRQLGITLIALLSNYHFWEACRENRDLIEPAIDEGARWLPTDPTFPRLVMQDVEVEGVKIPAGARVDMCLGAANRDPSRWENPAVYDPFRPKQNHLGFGMGPHRCLGMEVAKQEMVLAINGLMDRFPHMVLDNTVPAPQVLGGTHQRGYSSVPVRFR